MDNSSYAIATIASKHTRVIKGPIHNVNDTNVVNDTDNYANNYANNCANNCANNYANNYANPYIILQGNKSPVD